MAEIASPASDPRSLRRHYPHQVQGVVQLDLSAIAAPPLCWIENKAGPCEVNDHQNCAQFVRDGLQIWNVIRTRRLKRFRNAVSRQAAILPLLTAKALCWCEKWPTISHSPVSTRFPHCNYQTYPCLRRCLRSSPCTSRRRHLFHRRTCHSH